MNKNFEAICEDLGWSINESRDGVELSQFSPAGEDFLMVINCNPDNDEEFLREIKGYYEDFDPEEHATMWVEAKREGVRGVPSLRILIDDADRINDMIRELVVALDSVD